MSIETYTWCTACVYYTSWTFSLVHDTIKISRGESGVPLSVAFGRTDTATCFGEF